jgi:U4/U6.U5 tri-snRNP component SNU23
MQCHGVFVLLGSSSPGDGPAEPKMADSSVHEKQGALNVKRRTWDRDEYRKRAAERERAEKDPSALPESFSSAESVFAPAVKGLQGPAGSKRAYLNLQKRESLAGLGKDLGRARMLTSTVPERRAGGFWCPVCECLLSDTSAYMGHVNGKAHQKRLGFTMRTERASVASVRERFKHHSKRKRESEARAQHPRKRLTVEEMDAREERRKRAKLELRRRQKAQRRAKEAQATDGVRPAESGRGGKDSSGAVRAKSGVAAGRPDAGKSAVDAGEAEEDAGKAAEDDEMMRMMGFSGFGGGKKK